MELGGSRLDKVIAELFPQYSRSRLQGWLKEERVLVNGVAAAKGKAASPFFSSH